MSLKTALMEIAALKSEREALIYDRDQHREDAQKFHKVMGYLRAMKKEHGLCQPRERKACTACNAKDALDEMVAAYKGAPIRLA